MRAAGSAGRRVSLYAKSWRLRDRSACKRRETLISRNKSITKNAAEAMAVGGSLRRALQARPLWAAWLVWISTVLPPRFFYMRREREASASQGKARRIPGVRPKRQAEHHAPAAAGSADKRDRPAFFYGHGKTAQHRLFTAAEGAVRKRNVPARGGCPLRGKGFSWPMGGEPSIRKRNLRSAF